MEAGACREGLWGIVDIPVWLHSDIMIPGMKTEDHINGSSCLTMATTVSIIPRHVPTVDVILS